MATQIFSVRGALKGETPRAVIRRGTIIAVIAFLTLIDLFGAQALLPQLAQRFEADPATMGFAVNASTIGMAIASLAVAWFSDRIDRKLGIWLSLVLLAVPTLLLAFTDSIAIFVMLRIAQGVLMATAFTLTMTYLSEQCDITAAAAAMAAYVTGNVASNFVGRLVGVGLADLGGIEAAFIGFAVLNLAGGLLTYLVLTAYPPGPAQRAHPLAAWKAHLAVPALRASFAIGFGLLFVFVGTFTYVNLVLVAPPLGLDERALGLVYAVFIPAIATTLMAGDIGRRLGIANAFWLAIAIAVAGLVMSLATNLATVLTGLALVGIGTFMAQAMATAFVGRTALANKAAANGLYLASYYVGGLVGSVVLGLVFDLAGWTACVVTMIVILAATAILAMAMREEPVTA